MMEARDKDIKLYNFENSLFVCVYKKIMGSVNDNDKKVLKKFGTRTKRKFIIMGFNYLST